MSVLFVIAALCGGPWGWLLAAIFFGGVLAPTALMAGLTRTSATKAIAC